MEFHPLGLLLCSALHIAPYFEGELVCEHLEHDLVVFRVMPHRGLDSEGSESQVMPKFFVAYHSKR